MKKSIKILSIILFMVIMVLISKKEVQAKSYSIENMDIQAAINQDGSVYIEQKLTYKFNGSYNGIYINIPYNLNDTTLQEIGQTSSINDSFYNGNGITMHNVSLVNGTSNESFRQTSTAYNGDTNVYTVTKENGKEQIKVYSPSENITKTFKLNYTINNLCVKHNDIGELYYNFIGGGWEVEIKNLNIDIYIPENTTQIHIWGHGPYNGTSKIISNSHANFQVKNIKAGQYVAARVLFDNSNIPYCQKVSNIDAMEMVYKDENSIIENREEKNAFTWKIIIAAICLLVYWIILMAIFENDKKYPVTNIKEEELFKKYNPMLAGCIQGSRNILARDIIAVILELINKKIIQLEIIQTIEKDNYKYQISKTENAESKMDSIENYVYNWIFGSKNKVNLNDRLKAMPKEKNANKKFKELNKIVEEKLAENGANQAKVPMCIRVFNVFLFILSLLLVYKHIMFNGFEIYNPEISKFTLIAMAIYIIPMFPLLFGLLYIPINLIIIIRHKINKTVQRITGQKVVTTTISLLVLFGVIILITALVSSAKYIIADEVLICIATILILTDNLMLKNNSIMIEDYSRLNALKDKIENYTLMEDRDIEQITLWEQYLSYAVSFGIANKIVKRIKGLNLDEDLEKLINSDIYTDYIMSDYATFYVFASLDRRFVKSYKETSEKIFDKLGSSGRQWRLFWTEAGGGFSGRWRFLWSVVGGGRRRPEPSKNKKERDKKWKKKI